MRLKRSLVGLVSLWGLSQGCSPAAGDSTELDGTGEASAATGGQRASGGNLSSDGSGLGGALGSGGSSVVVGGAVGGPSNGGGPSGGAASGGGPAGGAASGGAESGGAPGSGGEASSEGPCPVPSYISSDPTPIGWAAEAGGTTGGGSATPILVTSVSQFKGEVSGDTAKVIYIQGEFSPGDVSIGSNKSIIGCSSGAHIKGHIGIGSGSSNVIVRNVRISGYAVGNCALDPGFDSGEGCSSGADAIGVNGNAQHVWFDHCTVMDGTDGNLDITNDANFITVSWTKFAYTPRTDNVGDDSTGAAGHRFSNLVGGTDTAPTNWPSTRPLNVTWHHNWWADNVVERQPRVRYGQNHLFNNYYNSDTTNYCVRAGIEASILLEGNFFEGVDRPHEFNNDSNKQTAHIARGSGERSNTYSSTRGEQATGGGGDPFTPPYDYDVDAASSVPDAVKAGAGPH